MNEKSCFVAMPIRKTGTPEFTHYRAIYNHLKPVLEKHGYSVVRTDDIQKSGAITKDIVSRLAESDLVVCDLTELNPNVFYELGVRHALRGHGTYMILDESRTPEIPFDLGAYRVIKFVADLAGIETLTQQLEKFLSEATDETSHRDNPVHDWFPMLPQNVLDSASESNAAPLRRTIKDLQDRVAKYEKAFGVETIGTTQGKSPLSALLAAISDAEDGLLPSVLMDECQKAFEARDVLTFLKKVQVVIERNIRLIPSAFLQLASYASILDLDAAVKAIFDQALQLCPTDTNLRRRYLSVLAHSDTPADREQARKRIPAELALEIGEKQITVRPERAGRDIHLVGVLLDAYHRDKLHAEALRIAEKMSETFPNSTEVLRNYARALEQNDRLGEAMDVYRRAIFAPDVDDTSVIWLGNELHNQEKHLAAAETYALACELDPTDAANFSHLAAELAICMTEQQKPHHIAEDGNTLKRISGDDILALAYCTASCPNLDAEATNRLRAALRQLEITLPEPENHLSRSERIQIVAHLYDILRTDLTTRDTKYQFVAQQAR